MATITAPGFRDLTTSESFGVLASQRLGRLTFSSGHRTVVESVEFINDGEWIFGRVSTGASRSAPLQLLPCGFDVDQVHDGTQWSCVAVTGTLYVLDGEAGLRETCRRATERLATLEPEPTAHGAPARRHAEVLVGVYIRKITGRVYHDRGI